MQHVVIIALLLVALQAVCDENPGTNYSEKLPLEKTTGEFSELCISQFQQCPSPPPPRADPRELGFFENKLANAPPPGQKCCSNAPG